MAGERSTICGVSKLIKTNSLGNLNDAFEFRKKFDNLKCKHLQSSSKGKHLCLSIPGVDVIECPVGLRNLLLPNLPSKQ